MQGGALISISWNNGPFNVVNTSPMEIFHSISAATKLAVPISPIWTFDHRDFNPILSDLKTDRQTMKSHSFQSCFSNFKLIRRLIIFIFHFSLLFSKFFDQKIWLLILVISTTANNWQLQDLKRALNHSEVLAIAIDRNYSQSFANQADRLVIIGHWPIVVVR